MESRLWQTMLEEYGQQVTLKRADGETEARAFFQPVREKAP